MNYSLKFLSGLVIAFVAGVTVNNFALSDVTTKIGVVDVGQVVASSAQVKALKAEQEAKAKEIISFVEKARKEVAATTDIKKKQNLEEKYSKELAAKKLSAEKNYAEKLANIDKSISGTIENYAKTNNFTVVLAKGVVLYGGEDITESVKKTLDTTEKASAKTKKK